MSSLLSFFLHKQKCSLSWFRHPHLQFFNISHRICTECITSSSGIVLIFGSKWNNRFCKDSCIMPALDNIFVHLHKVGPMKWRIKIQIKSQEYAPWEPKYQPLLNSPFCPLRIFLLLIQLRGSLHRAGKSKHHSWQGHLRCRRSIKLVFKHQSSDSTSAKYDLLAIGKCKSKWGLPRVKSNESCSKINMDAPCHKGWSSAQIAACEGSKTHQCLYYSHCYLCRM